jgi:hypothetical protein
MKLSQAIRLGATVLPQTRRMYFNHSTGALSACAMGMGLWAVGYRPALEFWAGQDADASRVVRQTWPWLVQRGKYQCERCSLRVPRPLAPPFTTAWEFIAHLNDDHKLSGNEVADWVSSVEPPEVETVAERQGEAATATVQA